MSRSTSYLRIRLDFVLRFDEELTGIPPIAHWDHVSDFVEAGMRAISKAPIDGLYLHPGARYTVGLYHPPTKRRKS